MVGTTLQISTHDVLMETDAPDHDEEDRAITRLNLRAYAQT